MNALETTFVKKVLYDGLSPACVLKEYGIESDRVGGVGSWNRILMEATMGDEVSHTFGLTRESGRG